MELFVVMVGMSTDLNEFGFDPKTILSPAPPKKDPSKEIRQDVLTEETQRRYNICEFEQCMKKACGHMGDIRLCWDCGKRLEREFVSWKDEWRFVYDKRLSK